MQPPEFDPDAAPPDDPEAEWVSRVRAIVEEPDLLPEPVAASRASLCLLFDHDLEEAVSVITDVVGVEEAGALFGSHPDRFLNLVESVLFFGGLRDRQFEVADRVLGRENLRRILVLHIDHFAVVVSGLLRLLARERGLAHMAAFWGPGLLRALRRPIGEALADPNSNRLEKRLSRISSKCRLFAEHGPAATRLIALLGRDFVRKHLLRRWSKDRLRERIWKLFRFRNPDWETVLLDVIGLESFRRLLVEDPAALDTRFENLERTRGLGTLMDILGAGEVLGHLGSHGAGSARVRALGYLLCLRDRRPDDPAVAATLPSRFFSLLSGTTRHPFVRQAVPRLAEGHRPDGAPSPEVWTRSVLRLIGFIEKLDSLGLGAPPILLIPLLLPGAIEEIVFETYRAEKAFFGDLDRVRLGHLVGGGEKAERGLLILCRRLLTVPMEGRLTADVCRQVLECAVRVREAGRRRPPLPSWAEEFTLEVHRVTPSGGGALSGKALLRVREELLAHSSLGGNIRVWRSAFEAARAAGFRLGAETVAFVRRALRGHDAAALRDEGYAVLFDLLSARFDRTVVEQIGRLAEAEILRADHGFAGRWQTDDLATLAELLHELVVDRLPGDTGPVARGLARAMGEDAAHAPDLAESHALLLGSEGLGALPEASPIGCERIRRHRRLAERECGKLRPMRLEETLCLRFTPTRSLVNLVLGISGEDCSVGYFGSGAAARIFEPGHAFFHITSGDSEVLRGYLLAVEIERQGRRALLVDVLNPSNSVHVDGRELLVGVLRRIRDFARDAGFVGVLLPEDRHLVSNRARISDAAAEILRGTESGGSFYLDSLASGFQSSWKPTRFVSRIDDGS